MDLRATLALWITLATAGCAHATAGFPPATAPPPGEAHFTGGARPPAWVNDLPQDKNALYATGISGPTFYSDDAVKYAGDNARVELGRAISSHITSAFLSVETNDGTTVDTASTIDATHDYSDTVVENSEIVATWIDRSGSYSGTQGTAYALAKIDLRKAHLPVPPPKPATPPNQ
jgi:hypothetical protein